MGRKCLPMDTLQKMPLFMTNLLSLKCFNLFQSTPLSPSDDIAAQGTIQMHSSWISESCIKMKINLNFYFTLLCGAWKGFLEGFKAFVKPFEVAQRNVKIKNYANFLFSFGIGTGLVFRPHFLHEFSIKMFLI